MRENRTVPAIVALTLAVLAAGGLLYRRARLRVNDVALGASAKPVSVADARAGSYRPQRHYVATVKPWIEASVGPQFIAAYADTVLVRPGDAVKRGQVLATLDCRDANATQRAVAAQAHAIETKQKALAHEAARVSSLVDSGFAAPNDAEQKLAGSESQLAELMSTQAKLVGTSLAVNDCVLRSPFEGEIASRAVDPGAFVRPGSPVVLVIDRSTVRVIAEVPEGDFPFVAPGTPVAVRVLATGGETTGTIARRSPAASESTRTVHVEIDLPDSHDPSRQFPVGTTAEVTIDVGAPQPATVIPAIAAVVRDTKATVFVVQGDRARKVEVGVLGEGSGTLFVDPSLPAGSRVVTEGRSLLSADDCVAAGS